TIPGRKVEAPECVDQIRARLEGHLIAPRLLVAEDASDLLHCGWPPPLEGDVSENRQLTREVALDEHLALRNAPSQVAQNVLPRGQARIGDRPNHEPLILERQRQDLGNQRARLRGIGPEYAGQEADIYSCGVRIPEGATLIQ